jgi:predicted DNA-binding transcriptional regulator YafY
MWAFKIRRTAHSAQQYTEYMQPIDKTHEVTIIYTNWKSETSERIIVPRELWFGHTEWHKDDQWLLKALDVNKQEIRDFALKDIKEWGI